MDHRYVRRKYVDAPLIRQQKRIFGVIITTYVFYVLVPDDARTMPDDARTMPKGAVQFFGVSGKFSSIHLVSD